MSLVNTAGSADQMQSQTFTPTGRTSTPTSQTPSTETNAGTSSPPSAPVTITIPSNSGLTSSSTAITSVPGNRTTNTVLQVTPSESTSNTNGITDTSARGPPTANANSTATVIINVNSGSGDNDSSSGVTLVDVGDKGIGVGPIIGIVFGTVLLVLLIVGFAFYLYRRRKQMPRSPSFDASYTLAPNALPAAIMWNTHAPSSDIEDQSDTNLDRTVDLDSTGNLDSTLRAEPINKSNSSLWEDETILAARIPMEKLVCMEVLNEGGHGVVYHGQYRGERVAIKMLLLDKRKDMGQINMFLAEIKMMATIEHPRIVRFIGVAWDALSDLCAVSEYMPSGDLFSLLQRFHRIDHRPAGFDEDKAKIAQHIAQALTYLHSLDPVVLHRDLKSMNVLLTEKWDAKLTDFGVSRKWTVDTMTAGVGTRRWMAPEVMMGKRYDTSADIFSFGVVLSELDSHQPPYARVIEFMTSESGEKVTETRLAEMVATGRIRIEFSSKAPAALVNLGLACVNLDSRARPSASEVHYELEKILRKYQKYTL
ncbi:putative protein kinase [Plasmopara halstedii]